MTTSQILASAAAHVDDALDATGPREVLTDTPLTELQQRAAYIAAMQMDLDELARRTEFDLTKKIRQGGN